jgi:hypothetical protein
VQGVAQGWGSEMIGTGLKWNYQRATPFMVRVENRMDQVVQPTNCTRVGSAMKRKVV